MDASISEEDLPEAVFRNPDGTAATWTEEVPPAERDGKLWSRVSIGGVLAGLLWLLQYNNGVLDTPHSLYSLVPLTIGAAAGLVEHRKRQRRRYSTVWTPYSRMQRLKRASPYLALGVTVLVTLAAIALLNPRVHYWWYAWAGLLPLFVGAGLYLLKGEAVLTPDAAKAKSHFDALEAQAKLDGKGQKHTWFDDIMALAIVRYPLSLACLYGAYHFAFDDESKSASWVALGFVLMAGFLAHELSKGLLWIGLIVGIVWLVFAGISALPLSAAIIIGALIIAGAVKK